MFHFKTGNHRLPVESDRGRNSSVPQEERKCSLFSLNDMGDEFHYLIKCHFFSYERMKHIPRTFITGQLLSKSGNLCPQYLSTF